MTAEAAARLRNVLAALWIALRKAQCGREKSKSPAAAGLPWNIGSLLFLAEALVAGAAYLSDRGVLLLHARLVFRARHLAELDGFRL